MSTERLCWFYRITDDDKCPIECGCGRQFNGLKAWSKHCVAERTDDVERFWASVDKSAGPDGCWPWIGYVKPAGYGVFGIGPKRIRASRYAYVLTYGPIAAGLHLDHLCHTRDASCAGRVSCPHRRCCNPAHLEPVLPHINTRRKFRDSTNEDVNLCRMGHELTGSNRYESPDGRVQCRQCRAPGTERATSRRTRGLKGSGSCGT